MKVIATLYRSDGNETVGDMWTETKSFDAEDQIQKVIDWVEDRVATTCSELYKYVLRHKLTITIDQSHMKSN